MTSLREKISSLQRKSYKQRLKILWLGVAIAGIIALGLWTLTIKFRNNDKEGRSSDSLKEIIQNLKSIKEIKK